MSKSIEKSTNVFESSIQKPALNQHKFFKTDEKQVFDLYDIEQTIGQGHYAVVKLARHIFTGEKVAIKVIDKLKLDKISREHLYQEVKCMKLVQHSNVVRLYEVIDTANKLYLILEFGDGGDMYDVIMKHTNGISEKQSKNYFKQITSAIKYCHDLHVVHRDLKPENVVFFSQTGQVKLTDFGFSNIFVPGSKLLTSCGSLAYSAPEILLGDSYDAPAVDVWSLGVILYMLVTGRAPFQEANDSETLTMILDCKYYLPPSLSPNCIELITRMLVRDPEKRILLDEINNHKWFKELDDEHSNDISTEELVSDPSSSSEELNLNNLNTNNNNNINNLNGYNVSNKKNATKIKEKLLKMVNVIKRENLTEKQNEEIFGCMIAGSISDRESIIKALDEDQYNYITGTYYLLAERIIKKHLQKKVKRKQISHNQILKLSKKNDPIKVSIPKMDNLNNSQQILTAVSMNTNSTSNNQYQMKRKLSGQGQRNKLVRQIEENEEPEPEINTNKDNISEEARLDEELHSTLQPVANILLGNIIEDEEELTPLKTKNHDPNHFMINQPLQSRRSSRGTDNAISTLTILEEVETDLTNSLNNPSPQKISNAEINSEKTELMKSDKKSIPIASFNSNSTDKLDSKLDIKDNVPKNNKKYNSETSCSDNSDTELKVHGLKDYDWNRSASSSARSRNRYRHSNQLPSSLPEQPGIKRIRPISISSDTNELVNADSKLATFHTETLGNNKESASSSGCLSITSPYKLSVSSSNSNDYLASNLVSKSLSIEHRLANMSQMSINSQLSKNNSIRHRTNTETPLNNQMSQQLSAQHSTTPTPRESIVFNRGDDKPFSKILTNGKSSTDTIFNNEIENINNTLLKEDETRKSIDDLKNFNVNNHDRLSSEFMSENISSKINFNEINKPETGTTEIVTTTRPFSGENQLKNQLDKFKSNSINSTNSTIRPNNDSYSIAINNTDPKGKSLESSHHSVKSIDELTNSTTTKLDDDSLDKTLKSDKTSFIGIKQSNKIINSNQNNGVNIEDESQLLKHSTSYSGKSNKSLKNRPSSPKLNSSTTSKSSKKKCMKCCTIV